MQTHAPPCRLSGCDPVNLNLLGLKPDGGIFEAAGLQVDALVATAVDGRASVGFRESLMLIPQPPVLSTEGGALEIALLAIDRWVRHCPPVPPGPEADSRRLTQCGSGTVALRGKLRPSV